MKKLLQSRFFADYGMVFVLLMLCAYYSLITYAEQHPYTASAGRGLARRIAAEHGRGAKVLLLVRNTRLDKRFADALKEELSARQVIVLDTLAGTPIDVRPQLEQWGAGETRVDAIATHHAPRASWRFLQPAGWEPLAQRLPSFRETRIHEPDSFFWPSFLMPQNLINVVKQNTYIAIIAIGMTMVIITAGIDLSVGSVLALASVLTAIFIQSVAGGGNASFVALAFAALFSVLSCGLIGVSSGVLVTTCKIPAFVVTLAMMMICRGLALKVAVGYQGMLQGGGAGGTPEAIKIDATSFYWIGNGELFGLPNPIWVMIVLYIAAHVLMNHTALGRYIYAVGGNPEAARLSGVPVARVLIAVYALCAVLAGLGGVIDASQFEGGRPNSGELYELRVIAAVVVGGTSLSGGEGRIFGTLIGALIMAVIQNGLNMARVEAFEQMMVFGALILGAALLDQLKKRAWSSRTND